jgi:hypothetical protein
MMTPYYQPKTDIGADQAVAEIAGIPYSALSEKPNLAAFSSRVRLALRKTGSDLVLTVHLNHRAFWMDEEQTSVLSVDHFLCPTFLVWVD